MLTVLIKAVVLSYILPTVEVSALKLISSMLVRHVVQLGWQQCEVLGTRGKEHEWPSNILMLRIHCLHACAVLVKADAMPYVLPIVE